MANSTTKAEGGAKARRARRQGRGGAGRGLGTFGGVFTPSILTIVGLILFLRLGWVVGEAGVLRAYAILGIATVVALITSSSLSAIATNRKVRGGGDYYLISRSLGLSFGGALGLILFVAQSVSVAFYLLGFGEGLAAMRGETDGSFASMAAIVAGGLLFTLAFAGADLATRLQYLIMATLVAALGSFFVGGWMGPPDTYIDPSLPAVEVGVTSFGVIFAVFFPAITGFTQGVSMSGDLENPGESLPRGTFAAVLLSVVIYAAAIHFLGSSLPREVLVADYGAMRRVAWEPRLIDAGILAATLSSALASFLGAPRILQALAADGIFSSLGPFAVTHGESRNPRRAVLLTGVIALATVLAGNLNAVAALVSMFFLISYGLLNYATWVEATAQSPSFRPRFRFFHRHVSLFGTVLCLGAMLAISPTAAAVAAAVVAAVHQYLERVTVPVRWHDSRRAYRFHQIKSRLVELSEEEETDLDWRPHLLVFTEGAGRRARLLTFADWVSGGSGLVTAVQVIHGPATGERTREARVLAQEELDADIARSGVQAFSLVVAGADLRAAATALVQAWGVGPISANTILLNWLESFAATEGGSTELWYGRLLRSAMFLERNVVVLAAEEREWAALEAREPDDRRIDVWWGNDDSARLALLLAYLTTRASDWNEARIRLLVPASSGGEESAEANLRFRLQEMRIAAEVCTLPDPDRATLVEETRTAALVILPLHLEGMQVRGPFGGAVHELVEELPATVLVGAAGDVRLVESEEEPTPPEPAEADGE